MDDLFAPLAEVLEWRRPERRGEVVVFTGPTGDEFALGDDAIRAAEAEIARRGLLEEYADVLACNIGAYVLPVSHQPPSVDYAALGALITAPPEARVRAMLAVLQ